MAVDDRRARSFVDPRTFPARYAAGALCLLGLAALPAALTPLQLQAVLWPLYLALFAMSWDVVSGYTGQISFGHTLFFGLGGYTTAVLNLQHGVHPVPGILAGVALAALGGLLVGVPALRIRGPYLSLVTLVAPIIAYQLVILFGDGLPVLAPEGLAGAGGFGEELDPLVGQATPTTDPVIVVGSYRTQVLLEYYLSLAAFVAVLAVLLAVTRSDVGDVFTAIREDERVVAAVGVDPARFKVFAFVLSAAVGGLAGAMLVHTSAGNPLRPGQLLTVDVAVTVVVVSVLGGMGTVVGAAAGVAFFFAVGAAVDLVPVTIPIVNATPAELSPVPVLVVAILVLLFEPGGLVRWGVALGDRLRARLRGEEPPRGGGGGGGSERGRTVLERTLETFGR